MEHTLDSHQIKHLRSIFLDGLRLALYQKSMTHPVDQMFHPILVKAHFLSDKSIYMGYNYYWAGRELYDVVSLMIDDFMEGELNDGSSEPSPPWIYFSGIIQ